MADYWNSFIEAKVCRVCSIENIHLISQLFEGLSAYVDIFLPGRTTYSEEASRGRVTSANKYNAEPIVGS